MGVYQMCVHTSSSWLESFELILPLHAGNQSVTIDAPESGRANQGQGNNTSSGREDYIDQSRQGAK